MVKRLVFLIGWMLAMGGFLTTCFSLAFSPAVTVAGLIAIAAGLRLMYLHWHF